MSIIVNRQTDKQTNKNENITYNSKITKTEKNVGDFQWKYCSANLKIVFFVAVKSSLMSTQLKKTDEARKKQVFSDEEDAVHSTRHTAHVDVTTGSSHRERVEHYAEHGQRRHQIVLGDVLEVVVELADQSRVVRTVHVAHQRQFSRLRRRV